MIEEYKTSKDSEVVLTELMLPSHSNFSGKIHGGFILSLMDKAAFSSASKFSGQYCVTASVNRVDFLNPIKVGDLVTLQSRINYVGNSSMVVGIKVESQNIRTGEIKHCNSSYFTMIAKDESGKTVRVPGLILDEINGLRRYLRAIEHIQTRNTRKEIYDKNNFIPKDYKEILKNYNVKLELKD